MLRRKSLTLTFNVKKQNRDLNSASCCSSSLQLDLHRIFTHNHLKPFLNQSDFEPAEPGITNCTDKNYTFIHLYMNPLYTAIPTVVITPTRCHIKCVGLPSLKNLESLTLKMWMFLIHQINNDGDWKRAWTLPASGHMMGKSMNGCSTCSIDR